MLPMFTAQPYCFDTSHCYPLVARYKFTTPQLPASVDVTADTRHLDADAGSISSSGYFMSVCVLLLMPVGQLRFTVC